jgi:UDP-glucose 4-epimerase
MSKAVVTGGAGFIGSYIVKGLLKRGYHVTVIDNLASGRLSNIGPVLGDKHFVFVRGSILDLASLRRLFSGVDFVFHQAALPSVPRSVKNPRAFHITNTTGTLNVLLAARDNGIKKVIFASSAAVYGDTPTVPVNEDNVPGPRSPYAVTKLTGEYYCNVFQSIYGLKTVCLRYFNVFGPGQDPGSPYAAVIPLFIKNALVGKALVIFGNGEQTRDFAFVKDVAGANILAAESPASGVFNIGSGEAVAIDYLARIIIRLVGNKTVEIKYKEARPGDILHSVADITRASSFGYHPEHSLEEGLRETISALRSGKSTV